MRSAAYRPTSNPNHRSRQALRAMTPGASQPTTEEPTMRKKISVTLNQVALTAVRRACYGRIELDVQHIEQTLETGVPQRTRHTMAACAHLQRTQGLLDRIGWTDDDDRYQITLDNHQDVDLTIAVLREEAAAESATRAAALEDKATNDAERATKRELAIHEILSGLEAAQAAAIIDGAAATVVQQPSA